MFLIIIWIVLGIVSGIIYIPQDLKEWKATTIWQKADLISLLILFGAPLLIVSGFIWLSDRKIFGKIWAFIIGGMRNG